MGDTEEEGAVFIRLRGPPVLAAPRPAQGEVEAFIRCFVGAGVGWTLIKKHNDVRAEVSLDLHRGFRTDEGRGAVEVILKTNTFLGDFAQFRKGEDLEPATIREDRAIPMHEAVKSAETGDEFLAGANVQVVGVAKNDLRSDFAEFFGGHGLYGGLSADRHEYGCLNRTASGLKCSRTGCQIRRFQAERVDHMEKGPVFRRGTGVAGVFSANANEEIWEFMQVGESGIYFKKREENSKGGTVAKNQRKERHTANPIQGIRAFLFRLGRWGIWWSDADIAHCCDGYE